MATTLNAISNHNDVRFLREVLLYGGSIVLGHDISEAAAFWVPPSISSLGLAPVAAVQLGRGH